MRRTLPADVAQATGELVLQAEDADLLRRVLADGQVEEVRGEPDPVRLGEPHGVLSPERPAIGDERRDGEEQQQEQDRLEGREQEHRDHELHHERDCVHADPDRLVQRVALVADQLEPVGVVRSLVMLETRSTLGQLADLLGHLEHVQVGELDVEHVRDLAAGRVQEREDRKESRRIARPAARRPPRRRRSRT